MNSQKVTQNKMSRKYQKIVFSNEHIQEFRNELLEQFRHASYSLSCLREAPNSFILRIMNEVSYDKDYFKDIHLKESLIFKDNNPNFDNFTSLITFHEIDRLIIIKFVRESNVENNYFTLKHDFDIQIMKNYKCDTDKLISEVNDKLLEYSNQLVNNYFLHKCLSSPSFKQTLKDNHITKIKEVMEYETLEVDGYNRDNLVYIFIIKCSNDIMDVYLICRGYSYLYEKVDFTINVDYKYDYLFLCEKLNNMFDHLLV